MRTITLPTIIALTFTVALAAPILPDGSTAIASPATGLPNYIIPPKIIVHPNNAKPRDDMMPPLQKKPKPKSPAEEAGETPYFVLGDEDEWMAADDGTMKGSRDLGTNYCWDDAGKRWYSCGIAGER